MEDAECVIYFTYLAAHLLILKILLVIRKRHRELTFEGSEFFK